MFWLSFDLYFIKRPLKIKYLKTTVNYFWGKISLRINYSEEYIQLKIKQCFYFLFKIIVKTSLGWYLKEIVNKIKSLSYNVDPVCFNPSLTVDLCIFLPYNQQKAAVYPEFPGIRPKHLCDTI